MPHIAVPSLTVGGRMARRGTRAVPEEVAVALSFDGTTQAVMMASPADLEDFALGFALTEGTATPAEVERLEIVVHDAADRGIGGIAGIEARIWLTPEAGARLHLRRRQMAGPVGCGLCGIDSLAEALRPLPALPDDAARFAPRAVRAAMAALTVAQPLHDITRAVHAAGFLAPGGAPEPVLGPVREDVGRHNALDKVIGALARAGGNAAGGALLITSRVSVDMVQKAVLARAPLLVAVSAPTGLAIRLAEGAGLTLAALVRGDGFEVFSHPQRIDADEASDVA